MIKETKRREKINLMLNQEERKIITEKAIKYGYGKQIAQYVRDACIYEKLYVEDVSAKSQICQKVDELIKEVRKYCEDQKEIFKSVSLSQLPIDFLMQQNDDLIKSIRNLSKTLIDKLSDNSVKQFQKRLRLVEKTKVTQDLINKIIKKKFYVIYPSSLKSPRIGDGVLIVFNDNYKSYNLDYINYNIITALIDEQRELAIQNNYYIMIEIKENNLKIYLTEFFRNKDEGKRVYNNYLQKQKDCYLYYCSKREEG